LTDARSHFDRQETLLRQGWTTRANFDVAIPLPSRDLAVGVKATRI
jgi:hypothetical protein